MSLRREWDALRAFWRQELRYDFRDSAVSFCILVLIGYLAGSFVPFFQGWLADMSAGLMSQDGLVSPDGGLSVPGLLLHNLRACLMACLYGLIPFLRLPALALGLNGLLLGGSAALFQAQGLSPLLCLAAILPHGVFELPALCLSFSLGLRLCGETTMLCRRQEHRPFASTAAACGLTFVLCVLPLLAAAACVEAWVTPALLARLL